MNIWFCCVQIGINRALIKGPFTFFSTEVKEEEKEEEKMDTSG